MRAITQHRYGGTDRLVLDDVPVPTPGPGEVLVRVGAAGVDRGVWHLMAGRPLVMRLFGLGLRGPKAAPGMDLAGEVVAVGRGVDRVRVGDEVLGIGTGAFAEYAVAPAAKLVVRPPSLSVESAAALPISGLTALQAVRLARLAPGSTVLVLGASGGVGSYVVQLARHAGAEVTGVCRSTKAAFVRDLGAHHVVAHDERPIRGLGPFDAVIEMGGLRSIRELRSVLAPRGTLVIVGGEGGTAVLGGVGRSASAALRSPFVRQRLLMFVSREDGEDLAELTALAAAGHVTPRVERTFPLEQVPQAIDHLADGRAVGKVVVTTQSG